MLAAPARRAALACACEADDGTASPMITTLRRLPFPRSLGSIGTMHGLGSTSATFISPRGSLKDAETAFRAAAEAARRSGDKRDLSVSYNRVGDVQVAQGDPAAALKSFSDSLAIRDRLAKSDPGNAGWQRDLAISCGRAAVVHREMGERSKALDLLRKGHEIMARLTRLSPENARWKADLDRFDAVIVALE